MKRILLSIIALTAFISNAQTDVALRINHKLGGSDFILNQTAQNNLGQDFQPTRLEYYLSQVTIVHDGGMETSVPLDTIALVNPGDEISTLIPLGNYAVTNIEHVQFFIGVPAPTNNEDPALYPTGHPLALQSPSMHWGWSSGYFFVAMEGDAGSGFGTGFELHCLGNANYFEVATAVNVVDESGVMVMNIEGDYAKGVEDVDVSTGPISHGSTGEAQTTLQNWRDHVFGNYAVSIESNDVAINWSVFPNPSTGLVNIQIGADIKATSIQITNVLGEVVENISIADMVTKEITLKQSGVFMFTLLDQAGVILETERVVIK